MARAAPPAASSVYRVHIDGLRAISAVMVIYAHSWEHLSKAAALGVRTFFVISGYLITNLLLSAREGARDGGGRRHVLVAFMMRRGLRIWPAYYLLLAIYLSALDEDGSLRDALPYYASFSANVLMVLAKEWTPWNICHLWSISVEEQFYLLWPFVVLFCSRRTLTIACVIATLVGVTHRLWSLPVAGVMGDVLPFAAQDALCGGALLALYHRERGRFPARLDWLAVAGALTMLVPAWVLATAAEPVHTAGALAVSVAVVARAIDGFPGALGRAFDHPLLRHVGRVSYGVYLYHALIIELSIRAAERAGLELAPGLVLFVLTVPLAVGAASLSWRYFEHPINELRRHFPYQRAPEQTLPLAQVESFS